MLADLHTHTPLCKHAEGSPSEYLRCAERAGLDFLGVSDHCPWPSGFDAKWRMDASQFPDYRKAVFEMKAAASGGPVKVLYGLEVDWAPGRMDEVWRNLEGEDFDYLIGSVHYVDGFPMDSPDEMHRWHEAGGPDRIWLRYAESLRDFVGHGGFDLIGHLDLPKKFGMYPSSMEPFLKTMREVFELAASKGVAVELNTAGLRKRAAEIYPSLELLKLAFKSGVRVAFGSDAHKPEEVAFAFSDAVSLAKEAGYKSFVAFERRKALEFQLPS